LAGAALLQASATDPKRMVEGTPIYSSTWRTTLTDRLTLAAGLATSETEIFWRTDVRSWPIANGGTAKCTRLSPVSN
jgi:hypothetical protein